MAVSNRSQALDARLRGHKHDGFNGLEDAMRRPEVIAPHEGKLAVLMPGLGAVATTFIAGTMLVRRGLAQPVGSLTQLDTLRLGKRTEGREPAVKEVVDLAPLEDLEFGGWDLFPEDALESAREAAVLEPHHLDAVAEELRAIKPMTAVFEPQYVKRLHGTHLKTYANKLEAVEQIRADIRRFMKEKNCTRAVGIWCGSTEVFIAPQEVHRTIESFERGLAESHSAISNSQLYLWAFLKEGIPYANAAPNLSDFPAAYALARKTNTPVAGKDLKTGQTLMKTILAPALKARSIGLRGWFSTNILGNRDGEVLDDPDSFRTKETSKLGVLDGILDPARNAMLYGDVFHKIRIEYYPPRGDAKEGWDNLDIFGWLGYPMQIKVNFLCRDSILAAPLVLDLALFLDFAKRSRLSGIQEWLSFYFKSPIAAEGLKPEHDLFVQLIKLKNTLRWLHGEDVISHLGHEYYD
jgi:myo-inositol-1-phosphate synthase